MLMSKWLAWQCKETVIEKICALDLESLLIINVCRPNLRNEGCYNVE